jgi:hypothetical protein
VGRALAEGFRAEQIKLEPFNSQISLEYIRDLIAARKIGSAELEFIRLKSLGDELALETAESLLAIARGK